MSKKKDDITNSLNNLIEKSILDNIKTLFQKVGSNDEFEFIFFGRRGKYLPQEKYIQLLHFFSQRSEIDKSKILVEPVDTLDITYQPEKELTYRLSIVGTDKINYYMRKTSMRHNHVIFNVLSQMASQNEPGLQLMKKEKTSEHTIDIDDLDLRVRLSKESKLSKDEIKMVGNLNEKDIFKIKYRYKQRTSLYVYGDSKSDEFVRIDLTYVRMADKYDWINKSIPNYELEVEYGSKKASNESFDILLSTVETLLKVVQQSNFVITNSMSKKVIDTYKNIFTLNLEERLTGLQARHPETLEIQHLTESLANRYSVTDKADGVHHFMIIVDFHVYLISDNIEVKDVGIELDKSPDKSLDKFNGTILDGEYVFIPNQNRHLFLIFDCLFNGINDVRGKINLFERLEDVDEIVSKCFVFDKQTGYIAKKNKSVQTKNFVLNEQIENHYEEIKKYMDSINHDMQYDKQYPLVRKKYFVDVLGANNWELFSYATALWSSYTEDTNINCPYSLDGLIFTPLEQAYVSNIKESQRSDYKWKPPEKNSIDFYVEFEKDNLTGKVYTIYDNSYEEFDFARNKPYRICKLYVGQRTRDREQPMLFRESEELYLAYLFLDKGEVRDSEGDIISDKTVVEFYYNNNPDVLPKFRWVPIRTRYDKTESVIRFGKRYGNYHTIADRVWRSIVNPILMSDFEDLAVGNNPEKNIYAYDKKMDSLRKKIGHELIISATRENVYYQLKTNMAKPMRNFHNWIKSNIIYTFCHPLYEYGKQQSVLDISCGRGGDINKFYYALSSFYVGIDIDKEGLLSAVDGAISRYNKQRRGKPNFPKMYFIQADSTVEFNVEDQTKKITGMSQDNIQLLERFFSKDPKKRTLFDRINCQFAIHYNLKNETTWTNFKANIKNYLRPGGYFLVTTYDGVMVNKILGNNDKFTQEYFDEDGKVKMLFEIVKKYPNVDTNKTILGVGNAIDVYISWISQEGRYVTEYLVDRRFLEDELKRDCQLELIDTDNFKNQMIIHQDFILNYSKYEDVEQTRNYLSVNVAEFYKDDSKSGNINAGCRVFNSLMRYYVFRKSYGQTQMGGDNEPNDMMNFSNPQVYSIPSMDEYDSNYSCMNSIHNIMSNHRIIPKHVTCSELFKDLGTGLIKDHELKKSDLNKIATSFVIEHEIGDNEISNVKMAINGMNIFVVEKNCNDEYECSLIKKNDKLNSDERAIILRKEGDMYVPVYKNIKSGKKVGLFRINHPVIQKLLENI